MIVCGANLYSVYENEVLNPVGMSGPNDKKRIKHPKIKKEKFVKLTDVMVESFDPAVFDDRSEAEHFLRSQAKAKRQVVGIGFIEYFFLQAIISWIVRKILDYYFLQET